MFLCNLFHAAAVFGLGKDFFEIHNRMLCRTKCEPETFLNFSDLYNFGLHYKPNEISVSQCKTNQQSSMNHRSRKSFGLNYHSKIKLPLKKSKRFSNGFNFMFGGEKVKN